MLAPGPDCEPYHNRQPVILEPEQWAAWLDATDDPAPILRAGQAGTIAVERAIEDVLQERTGAAHTAPALN